MNFIEYAKWIATEDLCADNIEQSIWRGKPICPYCEQKSNESTLKNGSFKQYYCTECNIAYSAQDVIDFNEDLSLHQWCVMLWFGFYATQVLSDIPFLANAIGTSQEIIRSAVETTTHIITKESNFTNIFFGRLSIKAPIITKMYSRGK